MSIENFLSENERRLISDYIEKIERRPFTYVQDKGMPEPPDNKPMKKLMMDKRATWESALKVFRPGSSKTFYKAIMDGDWDCPIKSYLDVSDELLSAVNDDSYSLKEAQEKLAEGLQVCEKGKMKCPCTTDA